MITVPSQEIATFLGNHLDHALQRTGSNFLNSVAVDREFRAGCAIMDVLNAVESVQSSLRILLEKQNGGHDQQSDVSTCVNVVEREREKKNTVRVPESNVARDSALSFYSFHPIQKGYC